MGLSANRNGQMGGQGQVPGMPQAPATMPAYERPHNLGQFFDQHPTLRSGGSPYAQPQAQQPLTAQMPQVQPSQYAHLQNFAHSQSPLVAILGRSLMSGMEHRREAAGMSPEDWQAQIDARRAAFRSRQGF